MNKLESAAKDFNRLKRLEAENLLLKKKLSICETYIMQIYFENRIKSDLLKRVEYMTEKALTEINERCK